MATTHINQHFVIDDSGSMAPRVYGPKDKGRMKLVIECVEPVVPDCKSIAESFSFPFGQHSTSCLFKETETCLDSRVINSRNNFQISRYSNADSELYLGINADPDGIDISTINTDHTKVGLTAAAEVADFISEIKPQMDTPLGSRMGELVKEYWEQQYHKNPTGTRPKNFIIITDGEATDKPVLIDAILWSLLQACQREADPKQVTFFFLQVGHSGDLGEAENDQDRRQIANYARAVEQAAKFLAKLDDGLKGKFLTMLRGQVGNYPKLQKVINEIDELPGDNLGPYDIVDTMPLNLGGSGLNPNGVRKAMYGARQKELDDTNEGIHRKAAVKLDFN